MHRRFRCSEEVRLAWLDPEGQYFRGRGLCVNVSRNGMRLFVKNKIDRNSYLKITAARFGFPVNAKVRHSTPSGTGYLLGLEFNPGSEWTGLPADSETSR